MASLVLSVDGAAVAQSGSKSGYMFSSLLHYFYQRKYLRMIHKRSALRYDVKTCGIFLHRMIKYCKRRNAMRIKYTIFRRKHPVPRCSHAKNIFLAWYKCVKSCKMYRMMKQIVRFEHNNIIKRKYFEKIEFIAFHNTFIRRVICKRVLKKLLSLVRNSRVRWKNYIHKKKSNKHERVDSLLTIRKDALFSSRSRHAFYRTCLVNHAFNTLKTKVIVYRNKFVNIRERNTALVAYVVKLKSAHKHHVSILYMRKWVLAVKIRLAKYRRILLRHRAWSLFKAWEKLYNSRVLARFVTNNAVETARSDESKRHVIVDDKVIVNSYLQRCPVHMQS